MEGRIPKMKKLFHRSRRFWFLFGLVFLLLSLFIANRSSKPPRLEVGRVIDQFGTFRFPSGGNRLEIKKTESGNVEVSVFRKRSGFHFFPLINKQGPLTFEAERDWFVSVDGVQRVWVFRGRWKKEWGDKRKMPLGDVVPSIQAVQLFGMYLLSNGGIEIAVYDPGFSGDWSGVPQTFFDRIPDKDQGTAVWGEIPELPDSPPPLSNQQKKMFTKILQEL